MLNFQIKKFNFVTVLTFVNTKSSTGWHLVFYFLLASSLCEPLDLADECWLNTEQSTRSWENSFANKDIFMVTKEGTSTMNGDFTIARAACNKLKSAN